MMDDSLISVIMGVYYRRPDTALLERSVKSILDQTIQNLEVLICDDGSSDDAVQLLNRMAEQDRRIRLIRPGGIYLLPNKLNVCLRQARGAWIGRMDDDDYAHPERLKKQLDYLKQHPNISFVGCTVNLIQNGHTVGEKIFPTYPVVRDFFMTQPYIHPALLFRRSCLDAVNGYSEDKHCILCEDYDLLLRMYATGYQGANLQEHLLDYSISADVTGNRRMQHRWNEVVTRYKRFKELGVLGKTWPYVVKPIVVGSIPKRLLKIIKVGVINSR